MDYFRVEFPSRNLSLTGVIRSGENFDFQFGRRVVADVMEVPERAHWKDCLKTMEQEKDECDAFRQLFSTFDSVAQI